MLAEIQILIIIFLLGIIITGLGSYYLQLPVMFIGLTLIIGSAVFLADYVP